MTISRRHAKNKITMRDQFNLWPSRSYQIFIFNLRSTLSCKYEHEGEDKLKIRIDTRVSGWIDFRPGRIWRNFSFPVHSLLLKGGSKGTFLDMLREKLRLMMLRDVTTFSTSSLVLSAPCLLLLLPPPEKIRQSWISMDHTDFSNLQLSAPSLRFISSLISLSLFKHLFRIKCIYIYIYRSRIINY